MEKIIINNPLRFVFGNGSIGQFVDDYSAQDLNRLCVLTIPALKDTLLPVWQNLEKAGKELLVLDQITNEPTFSEVEDLIRTAGRFKADSVVGIGGGSVLDAAKLLAAQLNNDQLIRDMIGIGFLKQRTTYLACLPTTSGTGSEMSPNAIFLDETDNEKKGIISPFLVPDATYVDPELTIGVPPSVTAFTGIDAFTHCLEAFINRFAHPVTDRYALEGIQLIFHNLKKAYDGGTHIDARSKLALGSVYGGMCLGPVNTAGVHALAYPLGSKFKVPHGLSNALILPYVMEFNLPAATDRFALLAKSVGIRECPDDQGYASAFIDAVKELLSSVGIPEKLSEIDIPVSALEEMAVSAMKVRRLLKNNVREMKLEDIREIYNKAY